MTWTFPKTNLEWLERRTIFLTVSGSVAYGTDTVDSDLDVRGVAVPPAQYFYGYASRFEQAEFSKEDVVIYDIRKFFQLAANCNPNIIELLFTQECDRLLVNPLLGRPLLEARDLFLSRKARFTFGGYALGQLRRVSPAAYRAGDPKAFKHAMHLVRLLRMGKEILEGKGVIVYRPDREELLSIRAGAWSYERLVEWAENADVELNAVEKNSPLPRAPDQKKIEAVCCSIVEQALEA